MGKTFFDAPPVGLMTGDELQKYFPTIELNGRDIDPSMPI
jgi:hypothetical protein